jgi:CheY-like chemotaxis protein
MAMATTVLVLDRRDDFRIAYAAALRSAGIDVIAVNDAEAALSALETSSPKIIVAGLDPQTRDHHLELCRRIKADSRISDISILLTIDHKLSEEDVDLATDPGALVITATVNDGGKVVAAIEGMLAGQRAQPLRASLRDAKNVKQSA